MYYQPFDIAKQIQEASDKKHLEGVHYKGKRWYARHRAGKGHVLEFSFAEQEHAYYCWVGMTKMREELEMLVENPKLSSADRVALIATMGVPHHSLREENG